MASVSRIEITCTDGGRHRRQQRLGFIIEVGDRSPTGTGVEHMRDAAGWRTGYRFTCGSCGRSPEVTQKRWRDLVGGLDGIAATRLDISQLPF